ncbi:hypothetical protein DOTSEDRAFT_73851 [Lecanosticta acicola]|uniref:DUF7820 domain-containing protein n=1 Tax=Lecanosticta acicola TaxID=111012 RepID=A0AAI8YSB1_9PEZI|nr:hypothetical protein DOTSEDRAFT_73851 [Lecanosticta acicola]
MKRSSLLDGDATPAQEHGDVFGDEFETDFEFDGVADGFRPNVDREGEGDDAHARQEHHFHDPPIRTVSAHYAPGPVSPTMSRGPSVRNSIRKSRSQVNPFASPEDEETAPQEREHSLEFEPDTIARRSVSSASSHMYAQTGSPRFGAGPSHPYGMYQQGTMARSPSVTTTSTLRPAPRQSYSQSRPQHPYAMYPQGVDEDLDDDDDDDDVDATSQNPVPVGFPGLTQNYTRRIGPDGEDQDIIHEDGHTEQLPPYTRYPEDGPEKAPLLMPTALHSRAPVAGTDPGMPLMHQNIIPSPTPAPQSMSDQSALLDHRGSTSNLVRSNTRASSRSSSLYLNKTWSEKTWKEKRKTKFCGIPFWWILLALCVLGFIGAVLGGVLGGFIAGGRHANASNLQVVTSLYDASPIASPTSGAPPTGTFALTLGAPQETQSDCLPVANQQPAWSCDLAPNAALGLVVKKSPTSNGAGANLFYASYNESIAYGSQLNMMNTSLSSFITVQDNDDPENGPAFYFQQFYDKVVVVPENMISVSSSSKKGKRQGFVNPDFSLPQEWMQRKQMTWPGQKPWFCVWNGTFIEGFIYVQEPAATSSASATNSSNATAASTTPPPDSKAAASPPTSTSSPSPTVPSTASPSPTPPVPAISTVISDALTTATYAGPASAFDAWSVGIHAQAAQSARRQQIEAAAAANSGSPVKRSHRDDISPDDLWSKLDTFPYVIKVEERRLAQPSKQPYCQQYQILDNLQANFVTDDDGNPIIVQLTEKDPTFADYESAGVASTKKHKRTIPGGCHCQWMSGE